MNYIETKPNSNRFINLNQVGQILLNKDNNRILFNFSNLVEKKNSESGIFLPSFHYVEFDDKDSALKELKRYIKEATNRNIPIFVFSCEKYIRVINFDNVNSFYIKSEFGKSFIFINFNSSISFGDKELVEHSIRIDDVEINILNEFKEFLNSQNIGWKYHLLLFN